MTYVESAARSIAPVLKKGALVILESTSPVGSTEKMAEWLAEMRPDLTFPQQVGEQAETTRAAVENIAYIAALIAVNLAVMNLLPLPALDGGRIFFLVVNAVAMLLFKKQIPAKYENYIHFAGLILLLALMVVLVFSDVGKLIK